MNCMLTRIHDETIEKLLRRFKARGGIVNYFVFRCSDGLEKIERHRAVAKESLRLLLEQRHQESLDNVEKRYTEIAQELAKKIKRQRKKRDFSDIDYRKLAEQQYPITVLNESINENVLNQDVPQRVAIEDFIGCGSDTKIPRYHYAFFSPPDPSLHDQPTDEDNFRPEDFEAMKNRKENREFFFSRALPIDQLIFAVLNDHLFGETDRLVVYQWGTKCSDYFLEEDDYLWGNFFWTVYSPTYDWYIGILAAATID